MGLDQSLTNAGQERNIEVGPLAQSDVMGDRIIRLFGTLLDNNYFVRAILIGRFESYVPDAWKIRHFGPE